MIWFGYLFNLICGFEEMDCIDESLLRCGKGGCWSRLRRCCHGTVAPQTAASGSSGPLDRWTGYFRVRLTIWVRPSTCSKSCSTNACVRRFHEILLIVLIEWLYGVNVDQYRQSLGILDYQNCPVRFGLKVMEAIHARCFFFNNRITPIVKNHPGSQSEVSNLCADL